MSEIQKHIDDFYKKELRKNEKIKKNNKSNKKSN